MTIRRKKIGIRLLFGLFAIVCSAAFCLTSTYRASAESVSAIARENVAVFGKKALINVDEYTGRTQIEGYTVFGNWTYDGSPLYDATTKIDGETFYQYVDAENSGAVVYRESDGDLMFAYESGVRRYFCGNEKVEKETDGKYYSLETGTEVFSENLTTFDETRFWLLKNPIISYSTNNRSTITPVRGHNAAVAFCAPNDGSLNVKSLTLDNSGNAAVIKYCVLLFSDGRYYSYGSGDLWTTVAAGASSKVEDMPTVELSEGDELLIVASTDENRKERVKLNLSLNFAETEYSLDQTTKIYAQGEHNFRFYELELAEQTEDKFDLSSAKEFGKLTENAMPWDKSSGGWKLQQEVTVSPRPTNMQDGKVNEFRFHTYSVGGKYVTYAFTAKDGDCTAYISKLYLAKSAWNTQTTVTTGNDGISWGLAYYSGENRTYYTVTDEKWNYFNSTEDKDGILVKTDFPSVDMKADDKLLFIFSSNENKIIDYVNGSYAELYTQSEATGEIVRKNMTDDFVFETEEVNGTTQIVALNEEKTKGNWAIEYVNMSGDYSSYEVGETVEREYLSVESVEEQETNFNAISKKYYSADNVDAALGFFESGVTVCTGEDMPVAIKLNVEGAGRIKIHTDSFIKFLNDGSSDGVRFRIMRNNEVVFPANGGWLGVRDHTTIYLNDIDVFSVEEGDDLYFVFDCVGNTICDEAIVDFIVIYAADGETNTATYQLSGNIPAHENATESLQGLNGWSFVSLEISGDINTNVFAATKRSGCAGKADTFGVAAILVCCAAIITKKRREKR